MFTDEKGNKSTKATAQFINGIAKIKLTLNEDLTPKNNPRTGWLEGVTVCGKMFIKENEETMSQSLDFAASFFENKTLDAKTDKIDWVHDVGPFLKEMSLLYPQMQKIIDLYNYKTILMPSMKRCFDIED